MLRRLDDINSYNLFVIKIIIHRILIDWILQNKFTISKFLQTKLRMFQQAKYGHVDDERRIILVLRIVL